MLPVRRGQKQYRHDEQGSVIKLNHHAEPLPEAAPSGYRELIIAREDVRHRSGWSIPTATASGWCRAGYDGVTQIAVAMAVREASRHTAGSTATSSASPSRHWPGGAAFRLGESLILLEEDRTATVDPVRQARGWRYITLQVADIDAVHDELRSKGVREGLAPVTLGEVARISMILDPDGNWIELSRRASIVGSVS